MWSHSWLASLDRTFSQADEQPCQWALQTEDDPQTRQPLPGWMSSVLEVRVAQFVDDAQKWHERIIKRDASGRDLTKSQKEKYHQWKQCHNPKIIFDKVKHKCINDAKHVNKECFAVQLHLSEEASQLELSACTGQRFRLVLLRGSKVDTNEEVPVGFEGPVPQDAIDQLSDGEGEGEELEIGEEAQQDLIDHERDQAVAGECDDSEPLEDGDVEEIMGDSDEDVQDYGLNTKSASKVKNFNTRAAWVELDSMGLTLLPRHVPHCSIGFHSSNRQWHGFYPEVHSGLCSSFGGRTNRSEKEAILRTIRTILQAHICAHPKDAMWRVQLEKVTNAEATL